MTRTVRGVLEAPTVLRLDEAVELPLNVPVEVAITEPVPDAGESPTGSTLLALADTLQLDGPPDFSERWEHYVAEDERERNR